MKRSLLLMDFLLDYFIANPLLRRILCLYVPLPYFSVGNQNRHLLRVKDQDQRRRVWPVSTGDKVQPEWYTKVHQDGGIQ